MYVCINVCVMMMMMLSSYILRVGILLNTPTKLHLDVTCYIYIDTCDRSNHLGRDVLA